MIDPMTALALIKGGSNLISGIAGGIGGRQQAERQRERANEALTEARDLQKAAMAGRKQYGLGPSYADMRRLVTQDPTSDYLRQQALRQEAGQLQALAGGGARALLGGTQAVAQGTADRMAKIAAEEQQRKVQGLQLVGAAEQKVAEEKLADARTDLTFGRGLESQGLAALAGADDLTAASNQAMLQAGIQGLQSAGLGVASQRGIFDDVDMSLFADQFKDGGVMRGKTPGEFSHDNNPIDIMQDGAKIGEMTGGEGIVSPEDLGKLEQLAGEGKTSLHKFVRSLIKKLEKNSNG